MSAKATDEKRDTPSGLECFVIMPISDQADYKSGHFSEVFEDIIAPSVVSSGYKPVRADQDRAANIIHLEILRQLLNAPMAVCDLSSVNPNVMFELGIRQAFDKPVVLIKDDKTRNPFDISIIRYVEYDHTLSHRGVKAACSNLSLAMTATKAAAPETSTNSIVRLLGLQAAAMKPSPDSPETARLAILEKMISDLSGHFGSLKSEMRTLNNNQFAAANMQIPDLLSKIDSMRAEITNAKQRAVAAEAALQNIQSVEEKLIKRGLLYRGAIPDA